MYLLRTDSTDFRDYEYTRTKSILRPVVDLRDWCSRVEDQRDLGSCSGAAVVGAYELILKKDYPEKYTDLSSLFVYYNARLLEDSIDKDNGAFIRSAIKAAYKYGLCAESTWPYFTDAFAALPPIACYENAMHRKIKNYHRLSDLDDTLDALNNNHPVMIGVALYTQFNDITRGDPVLKMPMEGQDMMGSHAVCAVGYDAERKQLLIKNSFGSSWGMHGYFWMPYEYAEKEINDQWVFDIEILN